MTVKLHGLKKDEITFLLSSDDYINVIPGLSHKYKIQPDSIILLSQYLKTQDLKKESSKLGIEELCQGMVNGEFSVEPVNGELILFRENPGYHKVIDDQRNKPGDKSISQGLKDLDLKGRVFLSFLLLGTGVFFTITTWFVTKIVEKILSS